MIAISHAPISGLSPVPVLLSSLEPSLTCAAPATHPRVTPGLPAGGRRAAACGKTWSPHPGGARARRGDWKWWWQLDEGNTPARRRDAGRVLEVAQELCKVQTQRAPPPGPACPGAWLGLGGDCPQDCGPIPQRCQARGVPRSGERAGAGQAVGVFGVGDRGAATPRARRARRAPPEPTSESTYLPPDMLARGWMKAWRRFPWAVI
ncbi:uncharacterized protein LOC123647401 [Lemur catta]|uniref:uncharacterized protein LOC123647401 n=1 Tax=Lemur catta TaxID=9447 RepID=UPI001E26951F|nr:uncharacterized protein LOC123647401 [Lemur catta]